MGALRWLAASALCIAVWGESVPTGDAPGMGAGGTQASLASPLPRCWECRAGWGSGFLLVGSLNLQFPHDRGDLGWGGKGRGVVCVMCLKGSAGQK